MRGILDFFYDNRKKVLLLYWVILSSCYVLISNKQLDYNVIVLRFIGLIVVSWMAYYVMLSWKFAIVFPVLLVVTKKGAYSLSSFEQSVLLFAVIAGLFINLIFIKKKQIISAIISGILAIANILFVVIQIGRISVIICTGLRSIADNTNRIFLFLAAVFLIVTFIKKMPTVIMLAKRFKKYIIVFFLWYFGTLFGGELLESGEISALVFRIFLIFVLYVFLTMWWYPGYYYDENMGYSHRFDIFANDYRDIHTQNVSKVSGEDSDYFTVYKLNEIERLVEKTTNFLDFGCGDGNTAKYFSKKYKDIDYVGIDVSEMSIEKACSLGLSGCEFKAYDGETIPYEDNHFDTVFMACVLHHIQPKDRNGLLKECRRVLKPGGKLIIFEHNPWNIITCNTVDQCPFDEDAILLSPLNSWIKVIRSGFDKTSVYFTLFIPRIGVLKKIVPIEKYLKWCPIGAQYYIVAKK